MSGFKYTRIPVDTFEKLVMNAGIVCRNFDPSTKEASNQIGATTGGLQINCTPEFADFGDDIDNCPKNMKELKKITSYAVSVSGTLLTSDTSGAKLLIGAADNVDGVITPRMNLKDEDFNDIWVIADYSNENTGANAGFVACHIFNALNTSGFSLKTADKGKGQFAFTLEGHVSIDEQDKVPFEVIIESSASDIPYITFDRHNVTIEVEGETTLTYDVNPSDAEVTFSTSASGKANVDSSGKVTGVAEGNAIITASITQNGVTYSDTCTVVVTAG